MATLSRHLLIQAKGMPGDEAAVNVVDSLSVDDLRTLCAVAIRLETYLDWAEAEQQRGWPMGYQRGYLESIRDFRAFALEGKLEEMLRDVGDTETVERVEKLLGVEP